MILGNGVGDRLVYRNDPPGDVRAFDARTGKQVWTFHTDSAARRVRQRHVGQRLVELHRPHQRVGADDARRGARARLPAGRRRRATTSTAAGGPARTCSPSRSSASTRRPASASGTSRSCTTACGTTTTRRRRTSSRSRRRPRDRRRRAADEAGLRVRVRSRDRQAGVADRRARRCRRATCRASTRGRRSRFRPSRPPITEQGVTLDDAFDLTPALKTAAQQELAKYRIGPLFTPPTLQGTVQRPGSDRRRQLGRRRLRSVERRRCS